MCVYVCVRGGGGGGGGGAAVCVFAPPVTDKPPRHWTAAKVKTASSDSDSCEVVSYPDPNVRNDDYRLQSYVRLGLGTRLHANGNPEHR